MSSTGLLEDINRITHFIGIFSDSSCKGLSSTCKTKQSGQRGGWGRWTSGKGVGL